MDKLADDLLEIVQSSRLPLSPEDIAQDARIWPIHRGEQMRSVSTDAVRAELKKLAAAQRIERIEHDGVACYKPFSPIPQPDKQKTLF